jgi:chemotaxis protein CheC
VEFNSEPFTDFQLDAMREVGNVGAGHAATALSQMVGRPIGMSITRVLILPTEQIAGFLGGEQADVAAVYMPVYGDICGVVLIFFPLDLLPDLAGLLLKREPRASEELSDLDRSAIKELGSILTGSYLSALYRFIHVQMIHGVPTLVVDMAQAILDTVLVDLEQKDDFAIVIETRLTENDRQLTGRFFLLPEAGTLPKLFKAFTQSIESPGNA